MTLRQVFPGGAGPEPNSDIESEAEATAGKATAVRSSPGSKTRPTAGSSEPTAVKPNGLRAEAEGPAEGFGSVQEEARFAPPETWQD